MVLFTPSLEVGFFDTRLNGFGTNIIRKSLSGHAAYVSLTKKSLMRMQPLKNLNLCQAKLSEAMKLTVSVLTKHTSESMVFNRNIL